MFRHHLRTGYKLIIVQLILLSIVAGIFVLIKGWSYLVSVLLGGSAWIIPSLYFVRKLFKPKAIRNLHDLLKDFLWGERIKLLLSAGLIILIMLFFTVKTIAFLSGYIATIVAVFLTPFWYKK